VTGLELRELRGDADLEAWADVSGRVTGTRWSVEEMRRFVARDGYLYRLAYLDGEAAGALVAGESMIPDRAFAGVRVLPDARRRGVGTALLRVGVAQARALGRARLGCEVAAGDRESLAFATRRGFEQWAVEVELVRDLDGAGEPPLPAGLEVVPLADRPDLLDSAWEVCDAAYQDLPLPEPVSFTRAQWLEEDVEDSRVIRPLTLVAVRDGRVVAFAGALAFGADASAAENGLTAVRRELRGQGLGTLLKRVQAARAGRLGYRRLVTYTQEGNDAMRRVNDRLGYVERPAWLKLAAAVDTVERALRA
jgi:GNAT superfamily N-acetyltransferase